jgi:putative transposase
MSWREVSVMEQRQEFVRLALLEGSNRRELCRRFSISPQTGYKWLRRWEAGETDLSEHSRRPLHSPNRTGAKLEKHMLEWRDAHPAWGARKLAARLQRENIAPPAASTVHEILRRNDRVIETAGQGAPLTRFEKPAPNLLWQMDFKGWVKLTSGTRCHPLTVVDDHSRYLVCLKACAGQTEETVRGHLELAFRHHGLPDAMFVDNGSPWGSGPAERWTRFCRATIRRDSRRHAKPWEER